MSFDRITRLVIHGNRRLLTKRAMTVDYRIEEDLQVIIGGNGYGKSTLFEELSPLPAEKKNYIKGGFKRIYIEAGGHKYELLSDFTSGNHHEFLRDGVELNVGHTLPVQRSLVEKEFGYTSDIHNLLIGRIQFTEMDSGQRKEWLAKLSPASVDYALDIFKQVSSEVRNHLGALKNLKDKLFEAQRGILAPEQLVELEKTIADAQALVKLLYDHKEKKEDITDDELRAYENFDSELGKHKLELESVRSKLSAQPAPYERIEQLIDELDREILVDSTKLSQLSDEHHHLQDTLNDIAYSDERTNDEILKRCAELTAKQKAISDCVQHWLCLEGGVKSRDLLNMVIGSDLPAKFDGLVHTLEANPNLSVYNDAKLTEMRRQHLKLSNEIKVIDNRLSIAREKLEEAKRLPELRCPKCDANVPHGHLDPVRIEEYIRTQTIEMDKLSAELAIKDEYIYHHVLWAEQHQSVERLMSQYCMAKSFWDWIADTELLLTNPQGLVGKLHWLTEQLRHIVDLDAIEAEMSQCKSILEMRQASEVRSVDNIKGRMGHLEKQIDFLSDSLGRASGLMQQMESDQAQYQNLGKTLLAIIALRNNYERGSAKVLKNLAIDEIDAEIARQTRKIGMLADDLSKSVSKLAIEQHIKQNVAEVEQQLKVDRLLVENLSPTTGLIADVLSNFVNELVRQANSLKDNFWTTHLKILPCKITEKGLDYKFGIESENRDHLTEDVRLGSLGEKELVNFLFMMVARSFLGIHHLPLFLDEVGARFHENNRSRLYQYVKLLVSSGAIKQVFVISHFEATYRSLSHAQMNVLDASGVLVDPEIHNKHFHITGA